MTNRSKDDTNPSGLPPRRPDEDAEPGAPEGAAEGAAMPSTGGGAAVAPADDPAPKPTEEAVPGPAGKKPGDAGKDPASKRVDAAPTSDAEMPVTAVPAADLPMQTRHAPDPSPGTAAPSAIATAPSQRPGPVADHERLDRGLATLYGRAADRPVWAVWVIGGAAVLAGILALFMPFVATLAATTLAAAALLLSGTIGLFAAIRREGGGAIAAGVALSILSVIGGLLMLFMPLAGILAISTVIVAFLAVSGGLKLWYALRQREEEMPGRYWMLASGALSLALAVVLWLQLPEAALWLPGLFLAVDLLMYGAMMLALAWHLSRRQSAAA
ncbi:MAG: HdeD family acid-resistance protein [Hasllibacter sp.]